MQQSLRGLQQDTGAHPMLSSRPRLQRLVVCEMLPVLRRRYLLPVLRISLQQPKDLRLQGVRKICIPVESIYNGLIERLRNSCDDLCLLSFHEHLFNHCSPSCILFFSCSPVTIIHTTYIKLGSSVVTSSRYVYHIRLRLERNTKIST